MTSSTVCILATIFVYLVGMLVIGFHYAKKNESSTDFYLGGRKLGPLVTAMSAEASDMSSYLLMGLPGLAYLSGVADVGWTAIGLAVGTYLNWLLTAGRLRRYTHKTDSFTLPQFFSHRFRDKKNILSCMAALIIIIFFIPYTASGFAACGKLFSSLFGMNYMTAMLISAIVIVGYTAAGGFFAASTTDFVQSIIMTVAIVFVLIYATVSAGGVSAVAENAKQLPGYLSFVSSYSEATGESEPYNLLHIITTLSWGLGYFGMPHILVRFMSIEKPSMIKKSATVAIIWVILSLAATCLIAYFGRMFLAEELLTAGAQKMVFIDFARKLFPSFIAGILMAAIIAASMSTADSQLLVASSSFTSDIYKPIIRKDADEKEILWVGRIIVVIVAVIAFFIASSKGSGAQAIMNLVENAWAGFGSSFGPVILLSLFWRRFTYKGAIGGVLGGIIVDILWFNFLSGSTGIYELFPGFIAGLICAVVVTLLDKKPAKEVTDLFDRAVSEEDE